METKPIFLAALAMLATSGSAMAEDSKRKPRNDDKVGGSVGVFIKLSKPEVIGVGPGEYGTSGWGVGTPSEMMETGGAPGAHGVPAKSGGGRVQYEAK